MHKSRVPLLITIASISVLPLFVASSAMAAFTPGISRDDRAAETTSEAADDHEDQNLGGGDKVIDAIAAHFDVTTDTVRSLHDSGHGFGEIYRAYSLSKLTGQPVDTILGEHAAGAGWGELYKGAGQRPGRSGLGSIVGKGHGKPEAMVTPGATVGGKPGKSHKGNPHTP